MVSRAPVHLTPSAARVSAKRWAFAAAVATSAVVATIAGGTSRDSGHPDRSRGELPPNASLAAASPLHAVSLRRGGLAEFTETNVSDVVTPPSQDVPEAVEHGKDLVLEDQDDLVKLDQRRATAHRRPPDQEIPHVERKLVRSAVRKRKQKLIPTLDELRMTSAIAERMTALERCYERALLRRPGAQGKLVIVIRIAEDGRVVSSKVARDGVGDPWLAQCALGRIGQWRLPALVAQPSVTLSIPVTFQR